MSELPSVDRVLGWPGVVTLANEHGRALVTEAVRTAVDECRKALLDESRAPACTSESSLTERVEERVREWTTPSLRPVFNLTGTVLHTNLGRALLPEEAIDAMSAVARQASNLEFDLGTGRRGERNSHIERWLRRLTGAEAAVVVNNNAAAVLLALNSLARRKEVPVSRGELIEIGGAFRMPDIMSRAGCKLVEVGTTNRTHLKDYREAITDRTAMLMKVHTSNYEVTGFTASVPERELVKLAREHDLPVMSDLGSGSLVDLTQFGLPDEPTVGSMIEAGVDLVTFSGDKLLGGPQAGLIAGRGDLIKRIKRNPMLRALRVDKVTMAALSAVLGLYANPEKIVERVPSLRLLSRQRNEIHALAQRVSPHVLAALGDAFAVEVSECRSQVGSGALPVDRLDSAAIRITVADRNRSSGRLLNRLAARFRELPVPVIGRVSDDAYWLDLRCLEDEAGFVSQLEALRPA